MPVVNHNIDWAVDDENQLLGYMRPNGDIVSIARFADPAGSALVGPDGRRVSMGGNTHIGPGTQLIDWATSGTLSLASANGAPEAVTLDTSVTYRGQATQRLTLKAGTTYQSNLALSSSITMAKIRTLQVPIRFSSNAGFGAGVNHVQLWFYDSTLGKQIRTIIDTATLTPGEWHVVSLAAGGATEGWAFGGGWTNSSDIDAETVPRVRVVIVAPAGSDGVNIWLGPITMNARSRGIVSIVADGQYSSQHSYIRPMVDGLGMRMSLAIQSGAVGDSGRMTAAQLGAAYSAGHEIIVHSADKTKGGDYANGTKWADAAAIQADIVACRGYIEAAGWVRGARYAVHGGTLPWNSTVSDARQAEVLAAYRAAGIRAIRKSSGVYKRLQSIALPSDPYLVQGAIQVTSTDVAQDIQDVCDRAEQRGEWGVITLHRSVLDSATPGALEMRNGLLNTALEYIAGRARLGAVDVLPFGEAAARVYGHPYSY